MKHVKERAAAAAAVAVAAADIVVDVVEANQAGSHPLDQKSSPQNHVS